MSVKPGGTPLAEVLDAHDVRYLSPAGEGRFGLPVGNGDLAALVWTPTDRLQLAINKSNTWDDAEAYPTPDWHWTPETEEQMTALVSCAELSVRNHLPLFDPTYLDDFEARLHLREAYISVMAQSPLCATNVRTHVVRDPDVLIVHYDERAAEPIEREIMLARWGSRRFFHWNAQISRDTSVGLSGTRAGCDGQHLWIEQRLRRISFAVVARLEGAPARADCPNGHTARLITHPAPELHARLFLAVVTSEEHGDPLAEAKRRVDQAAFLGSAALIAADAARWQAFWARSCVRLPDPYLENLYYFSRYQLGASAGVSAGPAYPPLHQGGLWLWNHDVGNWGSYYHWNQQQLVWPVHTAGHPELAHSYYDWRFKGLDQARAMARAVHGIGGAFYTDVADRDGRLARNGAMDHHLDHNLTCGSQIAMDFWRHYLYSGDLEFLRERAYPVMQAAAQFYLEYVERDAQGVYHVPASTGYEGHLLVRDSAPDLATIRQSFAACIRAAELLEVDGALRARWSEVLEHLAAFAIVEEDGQPVIAAGIAREPGPSHECPRPYHTGDPIFYKGFWLPMAPAFPSGAVGLVDEGTPLFEAARNAVRMLGPTSAGGWIPSAVFAARLGMGEEALAWMAWYVGHCQSLPQGFMQEGQYHSGSTDIWEADEPRIIRDGVRTDERTQLWSWRHDVAAPECQTNLMTMVQEMLLQSGAPSGSGTIRVFPAMPAAWADAAFELHAAGGFVVAAERRDGETLWVRIRSTRGGSCCLANPWPGIAVTLQSDVAGAPFERRPARTRGSVVFNTQAGRTYVLCRAAGSDEMPRDAGALGTQHGQCLQGARHQALPAPEPGIRHRALPAPEPGPRHAFNRMLGIPRYF